MSIRFMRHATRHAGWPLLATLLSLAAAGLPASEPPLLSAEIRRTLETHGAAAAERRFQEIVPARQDEYRMDFEGLSQLGAEYLQRGDMATAQVVLAMVATLYEQVFAAAAELRLPPPAAESPAPAEPVAVVRDYGPRRTDLGRFVGVYGDPAEQARSPRNVFVDASCDGHLQFGAMWGDVAAWVMRSNSDTVFEQAVRQPHEATSIRLEFEVGADGRAQALTHTLGQRTKVSRLGELPEYFETKECLD